jgi:putative transcriptional regulator
MIAHHPDYDLLVAHASGASDEATSLIVATHLALCPECRRRVASVEKTGGALLADVAPAAMSRNALASVMARLGTATPEQPKARVSGNFVAPEPLRSYLGGDLDVVKWTAIVPGISYKPLFRRGRMDARLIRSRAGHGVGVHTHQGEELTLCLTGGYTDVTGAYARGDLQIADPTLEHRPTADAGEDCVVLAVAGAPLRFRSTAIGLLAKFFGF